MVVENFRTTFFKRNGILAWMVCLGMLISNMIVQGINSSFGEIMASIINEFDSDLASISLIPSVHSFAYYLSGYVCSILVKWFSFRSLAFFGGLASCIAFVASIYTSSITSLTLAYGLIGGMGNGIAYVPGLIACGFYFDDSKRAMATGIATSGNGIGIVVIPILMSYINENFGWRNSMLFLSSISPIICLVALVMLPLSMLSMETPDEIKPLTGQREQNVATVEDGNNNINVMNNDMDGNEKEWTDYKSKIGCPPLQLDSKVPSFISEVKHYFVESWGLLKQPKLSMYCLSHGFLMVAYFIPIDFLNSMMAEDHDISIELTGYIVPIIGVASIAGNLFTGVLISKFQPNPLTLHFVYNIGCGIFCFSFVFCTTYSHFVGIAILYGFVSGPISMLIMECLARMFGMDSVKESMGFIMLVYAVGAAIGAPIGGWIYDVAKNFDGVFCFSAVLYLLSALCGVISLLLNRKYEKVMAEYIQL